MYPLESITVPKNYIDEYPYKEAIGCGTGLRDERLAPFPRTEFAAKVHRQEYFAIITHMDKQIGLILEGLKEAGLDENTYIIFTADHGLSVGHHGLLGKQNMYDHSMRVPFLIAGPGIKAGKKVAQPIYLQDAMATSLDLAGVDKPDHVEFQSLMPILAGEKKSNVSSVYGKYMHMQRMIIQGDWKLIFYPFAEQKMRLFNLANDPEEMNDLAKNPEYTERMEKMKLEFVSLQKQMNDTLDLDNPGEFKRARNKKKKAKK